MKLETVLWNRPRPLSQPDHSRRSPVSAGARACDAGQALRQRDTQNTRLIRIWAVGAITPFERALVWAQNGTGNIWHNYFYLRGVRAENRDLKAQIEQMRLEQVRLNEDAAQARRLQTLLAFKEQFISKTVAAQVIGSSGSDLSRIVYIDKGRERRTSSAIWL